MLPLKNASLWRALSVVLLVVVLVAAVSPALWFFDTVNDALSWLDNSDKWVHALTFVALAIWFAGLFERRAWWRIAIGLLLFGLLVEFLQLQLSYRMADWHDIAANTAGIIVGLAVAAAGLGGWALRIEGWYSRRNQI
ncbi:MAG: VanZ family protein [Woeseiaceae bacterium]